MVVFDDFVMATLVTQEPSRCYGGTPYQHLCTKKLATKRPSPTFASPTFQRRSLTRSHVEKEQDGEIFLPMLP